MSNLREGHSKKSNPEVKSSICSEFKLVRDFIFGSVIKRLNRNYAEDMDQYGLFQHSRASDSKVKSLSNSSETLFLFWLSASSTKICSKHKGAILGTTFSAL